MKLLKLGVEQLGAMILLAMGGAVLLMGIHYEVGSLLQMGAGFIPVVLGCLLLFVGVALLVTSSLERRVAGDLSGPSSQGLEWRGWLCILGGIAAFVILGRYGGLVPASWAAVFIAALGDRNNTIRSSAALAAVITAFGVAVFHFGLALQLPLFRWD